jgi:pimeloyl-ACP methyl ester carboxylesterase
MHAQPRLIPVGRPHSPEAAVLVLHGGATRGGRTVVSPTQLSVVRMVPTARELARAGRGRLAVYRLLNSYRGWDTQHTPVADAAWGMAQVREQYGDLPFSLVGHSLGGRAALLAGELDAVESVVALNPWVYPTDTADLSGRRVLIVHGERDRVASLAKSEAVAGNLARTAEVEFVRIPGGKHAMLRHRREFDRRAADFTAECLLTPG